MEAGFVVVAVADRALRRILTLWLRDAMPDWDVRAADHAEPGEVIVATPFDLSAAAAAELALRNVRVVILAPMPRSEERERYALAGAAYVAMSFDRTRALENAIAEAAQVPPVLPGGATVRGARS